jgi:hypothetical protein
MVEKDLIAKLNNLKNISPDAKWLVDNRELFLTQIANSGANKLSFWQIFYINFKSLAKTSAQPVFASFIFLIILVGSSVFGHKLFSEAKPNDSLYIARVISEKAKLNTVLNSQARNKMAVKFAVNHAKDINQILANPDFNNEINQEKVNKLNKNFDEEMETVKNKIASLAMIDEKKEDDGKEKSDNNKELKPESKVEKEDGSEENNNQDQNKEDEQEILIAIDGDYKEEQGIQIEQNPDLKTDEDASEEFKSESNQEIIKIENELDSSSTEEIIGVMIEKAENNKIEKSVIEEIKKLFVQGKHEEVIEKLNQIIIE